jgi:ROS/MUCR transcriptional regulator protein
MPRERRTQAVDPRSIAGIVSTTTDGEGCLQHTGYPRGLLMTDQSANPSHLELTAEIVSAYVANNSLPQNELPALLRSVHDALHHTAAGKAADPAFRLPRLISPVSAFCFACVGTSNAS